MAIIQTTIQWLRTANRVSINPGDLYYVTDKGQEGYWRSDDGTGSREESGSLVDNLGLTLNTGWSGTTPPSAFPQAVLRRIYDGAVNVKWFGAKGDSTTDDTAAFEQALSVDAFDYFIPNGSYLITRTLNIKPYARLTGQGGLWSTELIFSFTESEKNGLACRWGNEIKDLTISGGASNPISDANTGLLYLFNTSSAGIFEEVPTGTGGGSYLHTFTNVKITNAQGSGIVGHNIAYVNFQKVRVFQSKGPGGNIRFIGATDANSCTTIQMDENCQSQGTEIGLYMENVYSSKIQGIFECNKQAIVCDKVLTSVRFQDVYVEFGTDLTKADIEFKGTGIYEGVQFNNLISLAQAGKTASSVYINPSAVSARCKIDTALMTKGASLANGWRLYNEDDYANRNSTAFTNKAMKIIRAGNDSWLSDSLNGYVKNILPNGMFKDWTGATPAGWINPYPYSLVKVNGGFLDSPFAVGFNGGGDSGIAITNIGTLLPFDVKRYRLVIVGKGGSLSAGPKSYMNIDNSSNPAGSFFIDRFNDLVFGADWTIADISELVSGGKTFSSYDFQKAGNTTAELVLMGSSTMVVGGIFLIDQDAPFFTPY